MSFLVQSSKPVTVASQQPEALSTLRVQTSVNGLCIPIVFGTTRVPDNLIWYADFVSTAHSSSSGDGGGGGKGFGGGGGGSGSGPTTYSYTAALLMAICEGPIDGIGIVWQSKSVTDLSTLGLTLFNGEVPQDPWGYLVTNHLPDALAYPGVALVAASGYALDDSGNTPQHSFEVQGFYRYNPSAGLVDADPRDIATAILTNTTWGGLFPPGNLDDLTTYSTYCIAAGLLLSPVYDQQQDARQMIADLMQVTNSEVFWSGNLLKIKPRGDEVITRGLGFVTITSDSPATDAGDYSGTTIRITVDPSNLASSATSVRVTLAAGSVPFVIDAAYIGEKAAAGNVWDFDGNQVQLTFNGGAAGASIQSNQQITSDQIDFVLDHTKALVISFAVSSTSGGMNTLQNNSATGFTMSRLKPSSSAGVTAPAGFSSFSGVNVALTKIEGPSGTTITFTPDLTPQYDLGPNDFVPGQDGAPILPMRTSPADAPNHYQVEHVDRANAYNTVPSEAKDQGAIDLYGLIDAPIFRFHGITTITTGRLVAQLLLQRGLYVRNGYQFKLSMRFCRLEPMDLVTLTDAGLGLSRQLVRIINCEEDDNGEFTFTAEHVDAGVASSPAFGAQVSTAYIPQLNAIPGDVNAPMLFDLPLDITAGDLMIGAAVSGGANWGGAEVWISNDNATYKLAGRINSPARMGFTTATFASGSDPDTTHTLSVDLSESFGNLDTATDADADAGLTLSYVRFGADPTQWEFVAYSTADLTAQYTYNLTTYIRRGVYGSDIMSHASGSAFARIDASVFRYGYAATDIGNTIYAKFLSFNKYGAQMQSLDEATAYPYVIQGPSRPPNVANFVVGTDQKGFNFTWDAVSYPLPPNVWYIIRGDLHDGNGVQILYRDKSNKFTLPFYGEGNFTFTITAQDMHGHESATPTSYSRSASILANPTVTAVVSGDQVKLAWSEPDTAFKVFYYVVFAVISGVETPLLGQSFVTSYSFLANFSGIREFRVYAIDHGQNESGPGSAFLTIDAPGEPVVASQAVDNFVYFQITAVPGTLPIDHHVIRKGSSFAGGTAVDNPTGSFSSTFEPAAGAFTYWIASVDSAGNVSAARQVNATVGTPANFLLLASFTSTFGGSIVNMKVEGGDLVGPSDASETWAAHFSTRGWKSPQDQINAGFPFYDEPNPLTGSYTETFDYGATIQNVIITVNLARHDIDPSVDCLPLIEVSLDGSTWTSLANAFQARATTMRYVRITLNFTASDTNANTICTALSVSIAVQLVDEDVVVAVNAGDAGGTTYTFTNTFIELVTALISPSSTSSATLAYATYSGSFGPNPTGLQLFGWDKNGTRASGNTSLRVRGYISSP